MASRNMIDCSKTKPVLNPETINIYARIFNSDSDTSRSSIADLATILANDKQIGDISKAGSRYQALAEWLCCVTNDLLSTDSAGNKTKIPKLLDREVLYVMEQNEDCATVFADDSTIINLASLTVFSYLADRKQQPRAELNDYICEVGGVVEMAA